MIGTIRKTRATATNLPVSDRVTIRRPPATLPSIGGLHDPAIAESRVIGDGGETGIDRQEFFPDTLDQGANIGAITVRPFAGDEILAPERVIDLAIAEIAPRGSEKLHHPVFAESQLDRPFAP